MLAPRFSIRTVLAITTACAVLFLFAGIAYRGEAWAWGATIGILSLGLTAVVHVLFFVMVWCFAQLLGLRPPSSNAEARPTQDAEAMS